MAVRRPHYLLRSQAELVGSSRGWSFRLQSVAGGPPICVNESEHDASSERLELLSVVRGLEALPEPARVTLLTDSDVVQRGIRYGLEEWRADDWRWESYGEMVPVRNLDLLRRIDRAIAFHHIDVRRYRIDAAHAPLDAPRVAESEDFTQSGVDLRHESLKAETETVASTVLRSPHFGLKKRNVGVTTQARFAQNSDAPNETERERISTSLVAGEDSAWFDEPWDQADRESSVLEGFAQEDNSRHLNPRWIRAPRRSLRVWRLHFLRRLGELKDSLLWFLETTGFTSSQFPWFTADDHRGLTRITTKTRDIR
ncbi:MAG: hypothetical protein QM811_03005 [Pirellulales bacterium]